METFTIRDLRERTEELVRDAEAGKLSVITKHGQAVFVAVPFDEVLPTSGVCVALVVKLFAPCERISPLYLPAYEQYKKTDHLRLGHKTAAAEQSQLRDSGRLFKRAAERGDNNP